MIDAWPINPPDVIRIGQGTCKDCRKDSKGKPRPHNGVDIYAPSGTKVISPVKGTIIRVVDGRVSKEQKQKDAGLWIDLEEPPRNIAESRRIHRFLHLGSANVKDGDKVKVGDVLGIIAEDNTSGLGESGPHLHYEIRHTSGNEAYGNPYEPKYDLADAVAAHAYAVIPKIAHIVGINRYGNKDYVAINDTVSKVWIEKDPDKRLALAHKAEEYAKSSGDMVTMFGGTTVPNDTPTPHKEGWYNKPGAQAVKEAGKELGKEVISWWDDLSTPWKAGVIAGGVIATGAVIKSFIPSIHKD